MTTRARFLNPTPRNARWFIKTLKDYNDRPIEDVNFQANTWRWLTAFCIEIINHRRRQGRLQMVTKQIGFLNTFFTKVGCPELVWMVDPNRIMPKKYCKAYRISPNRKILYWTLAPDFETGVRSGSIRWCSVQKDWFTESAFMRYFTMGPNNSRKTLESAYPTVKVCNLCGDYYDPKAMSIHKILRSPSCHWCATTKIKNPTPTIKSIYGPYHSHKSTYKFWPHRAPKDATVPIGVELEMQFASYGADAFNQPQEAWALHKHYTATNPDANLFYFEADGSLGESGIEMVTQPMSRLLQRDFWKTMLPKIRERFVGWNTEKLAGNNQFGIHLTFDISEWGRFHLGRLIKFIENPTNRVFIQAIAQRGSLYGNSAGIADREKKISEVVVLDKGKFIESCSKYQAINVKGHLCEVRLFRSTLNHVSFMKNLEFMYAFHEWCNNTPYSHDAAAFISWLLANATTLYPKYPNLYKFFCHETFPVKLIKWETFNPWQTLFEQSVAANRKGQKDFFTTAIPIPTEDYVPCV